MKLRMHLFFGLAVFLMSFIPLVAVASFAISTYTLHRTNGETLVLREFALPNIPQKSPNILLVHGLTYSSHQFDIDYEDYSLSRFLAKNGYRVWLIDITGYGRSSKPDNGFVVDSDHAAADIAFATRYIRKTTHSQKIDLLGWSWGTITAARFAGTHPEWINKLILFAPLYRGMDLPAPTTDYQPFTLKAVQSDMPKVQEGSDVIDYDIIIKEVADLYTAQCVQYDSKTSPNGGRRDLFQSRDVVLFNAEQLTMPVLVIAGSEDEYLNYETDIPDILSQLPHKKSRYHEIAEGSHVLLIEKAHYRHFQNTLLDFLQLKGSSLDHIITHKLGRAGKYEPKEEKLV